MRKSVVGLFLAIGIMGLARGAVAAYTIQSRSGSVMYTDISNGLDATYLVFQVTKTDAGTDSEVWAQLVTGGGNISNVGTGVHQIKFKMSTGAHGTVPVAETTFTQNETKGVFFLVKAGTTSTTPQSLTVNLFSTCSDTSAPGCANGTLSGALGTQSFAFTVEDTIQASANKVNTVITIPSNPQIGQLGNITVTGCTGTVGAGKVLYFSPVSADSWPADAFEFVDSDIQIENYAGSPYRDVALIPNADVLTTDNCYDEIFTFEIDAVGTANTSPSNFITSGGTNIKHTTNTSGSFSVTIPPAQCPTITVSSTPNPLNNATVGQPYSGTITASPAAQGTYSFSASGLPAWLSLNSSTGALTGTPGFGDVGTVSFTVTATDSGGNPVGCTGQAQFTFDVGCPTVTISSVPGVLPDAVAGQAYSASFSAAPAGTYTFSAIGLPAWLNLSAGGVLSGTPSASDVGPVSFTIVATESNSQCEGRKAIEFAVDPGLPAAQVPTLGGAGLALLALSLAGAAFVLLRRM